MARPAAAARYTAAEWETRVNLAALFRLLAHYGLTDVIYTHASARVPGESGTFLINPQHLMFHEVTASSLLKIDMDGNVIDPPGSSVNPAGYTIHSAILGARPDLQCVVHTHTEAGIAVACTRDGLLALNQWSCQFHNRVARHPFEGVALELDERERLAASLGDRNVLVLDSHGLATMGRTVPEAFKLMYNLERSCRAQVMAMSTGRELIELSPEVCEKTARQYADFYDSLIGRPIEEDMEWQALLRLARAEQAGFDA